jgi:hypothetical protein
VQDTDSDGIVSKDELLKAMTLLRGDFSEAEADAVKKLVAGKESVTLKQLEECAFRIECTCQTYPVQCPMVCDALHSLQTIVAVQVGTKTCTEQKLATFSG